SPRSTRRASTGRPPTASSTSPAANTENRKAPAGAASRCPRQVARNSPAPSRGSGAAAPQGNESRGSTRVALLPSPSRYVATSPGRKSSPPAASPAQATPAVQTTASKASEKTVRGDVPANRGINASFEAGAIGSRYPA